MGQISVADIQKWNPDDIARVFSLSSNIADHSTVTSMNLTRLDAFESWSGVAADDAQKAVGASCKMFDVHGKMAQGVADAARAAEIEVIQVKANLKKLIAACDADGFVLDTVSDTIRPLVPIVGSLTPEEAIAAQKQQAQLNELNKALAALLVEADQADKDLAKAIDAATDTKDERVSLKPSASDVVLGSVAGLTGAKTDIITDIWRASMGENPTGLEAKALPWLKEISGLGTSRIGAGMGAIMAVPAIFSDMGADHDSWELAVGRESGANVVGMPVGSAASKLITRGVNELTRDDSQVAAGEGVGDSVSAGESAGDTAAGIAETGAEAGADTIIAAEAGEGATDAAAVGTAICPGLGTVVGAAGGALVGAGLGLLTSKGIEGAFK